MQGGEREAAAELLELHGPVRLKLGLTEAWRGKVYWRSRASTPAGFVGVAMEVMAAVGGAAGEEKAAVAVPKPLRPDMNEARRKRLDELRAKGVEQMSREEVREYRRNGG